MRVVGRSLNCLQCELPTFDSTLMPFQWLWAQMVLNNLYAATHDDKLDWWLMMMILHRFHQFWNMEDQHTGCGGQRCTATAKARHVGDSSIKLHASAVIYPKDSSFCKSAPVTLLIVTFRKCLLKRRTNVVTQAQRQTVLHKKTRERALGTNRAVLSYLGENTGRFPAFLQDKGISCASEEWCGL